MYITCPRCKIQFLDVDGYSKRMSSVFGGRNYFCSSCQEVEGRKAEIEMARTKKINTREALRSTGF